MKQIDDLVRPERISMPSQSKTLTNSESIFPSAFQERMQPSLGSEWNNFEKAHILPASISIRKNPAKPAKFDHASQVPWSQQGCYLSERPVFTLDPLFHAGAYYVQEASSMFLEQALRQTIDLKKSLTVLDLCAAPGGKSTHILSLIHSDSLLVSNEAIRSRAGVLYENIQKWGACNVVVTDNDPADFNSIKGFFDVVVVDAPCSGEGLFRKEPEAAKKWSAENVELCSARQKRIVHDVWPALKTGGIFIYSTCTYNPQENEAIVQQLVHLGGGCVPLNIPEAWGIEEVKDENITGYRFFPHRLMGEGFFLSVIRKTSEAGQVRVKNTKKFLIPPPKITQTIGAWLTQPDKMKFIARNDQVQFFPQSKTSEIEFLTQRLHLITAGTLAAAIKHDKCIPDHALALSIELNQNSFDSYPLDSTQALSYLRKDTLALTTLKKGYALVTFQNTPLGWIHALDNRINNLYPSSWRIRMQA